MIWKIDPDATASLRDQIVGSVRAAIARGELTVGDRLPPASELGEALAVDRNTVLAAYRLLRDDDVLEFRRGRGVRVARAVPVAPDVVSAVTALIDLGRSRGLVPDDLVHLIREMT